MEIPLKLKIPVSRRHTLRERNEIPRDQSLILPFAEPYLQTWGDENENYILQQYCEGTGVQLSLVTIRLSRCSILRVRFKESMNEMLYTLQGFAFAKLEGHGCLPLFENTYTLQYVPEGEYEVLFVPGTYHFLYLIPGSYLDTMSSTYPTLEKLVKFLKNSHEVGALATRLPITSNLRAIIRSFGDLPAGNGGRRLDLAGIVLDLFREFHRQLGEKDRLVSREDLTASIYASIASLIDLPVPEIIRAIKAQFFVEAPTLRHNWVTGSKTGAPRAGFKELRLQYGLYLLTVEGCTVAEATERLNFKNPSHFSAQFRKRFQVPPSKASGIVER